MVNAKYGFSKDSSASDIARRRAISDYSRATGAWADMNIGTRYYGSGYWWLRAPYNSFSRLAQCQCGWLDQQRRYGRP